MTVRELIAELQSMPQGYEVHVATSGGSEPFWPAGNLSISPRMGRITVLQSDDYGQPMPEGSNDIDAEDRCEYAGECMHFDRVRRRPFLRQHVRDRNLEQCQAADARH